MKLLRYVSLFAALSATIAPAARAQDDVDEAAVAYEEEPADVVVAPWDGTAQLQVGASASVPTWYGESSNYLGTGFGLHGFVGFDLGYIDFELRGGWQWQELDLGPSVVRGRTAGLQRSYFALGVKAEAHNRSIVTPWLGASLDFNFWNVEFETAVTCGYYYCYEENVWRYSPGFSARVGASVQPGPGVSFDFGLELGTTLPGNVFADRQSWVAPFLGVTLYGY